MCTTNKQCISFFLTALSIFIAGSHVYADDTEVYINNPSSTGINPNVLFIVDTSGSMGFNTVATPPAYDPTVTYTGGTCLTTRFYWDANGSAPSCSTQNYFDIAAFKCKDAGIIDTIGTLDTTAGTQTSPLYTVGQYNGRLARYKTAGNDAWTTLSSSNHTDSIECTADNGIHGDGADTSAVYPTNGVGTGWASISATAIDWSTTGSTYSIYHGNYLNYLSNPGATTQVSRLGVVQGVLISMINSTSGINAGLMRFSSNGAGGYILQDAKPVIASTRSVYNNAVQSLVANGNTPLAETMYEALLWFKGNSMKYGVSPTPTATVNDARMSSVATDLPAYTTYQSPIEYQCQKNFVILLTDGEPTDDGDADTDINNLSGFTNLTHGCAYNGTAGSNGDCLDELAQYMYEVDQIPDATLPDKQNIITYVIGFGDGTDTTLMNQTARKGGSTHPYFANDRQGLRSTFAEIFLNILDISTTFTAPAVSVNAFNRLTHRGELYFALFKPADSTRWHGNLKRYKIKRNTTTNMMEVVDYTGAPAVDPNTGFFSTTSQSWWPDTGSTSVDGDDVEKGGASHQLPDPTLTPPEERTVYTYTGAADPVNTPLKTLTGEHKLHESNATDTSGILTNTLLDVANATTEATRMKLVQWARGIDVDDDDGDGLTTDARMYLGDPLHSKPVLVSYSGASASTADISLFVATNEGFIHAFDMSEGATTEATDDTVTERFAFIPKELLPNLDILYTNSSNVNHTYGMDGALTKWHKDNNNDLLVLNSDGTTQTGEHLYLYAGMRRGGRNYYALDVTRRESPVLKWVIKGGVTAGFNELGQTWSEATYIKIKWNGVDKDALVFGGGYDTNQDTAGRITNDSVGRAVYVVDAETGALLWWAGPSTNPASGANLVLTDMKNGIAADITPIDSDNNGFIDRLYAADLGGRVWRFDINDANTGASNFATGGVFASISGNTAASARRFYYAPDVALIQKGGIAFYSVSIGSGYRAHPLNLSTDDRFYVFRDHDIHAAPTDTNGNVSYTPITEAGMYDATLNLIQTGTPDQQATAITSLAGSSGWYITVTTTTSGAKNGEKVMASSLTLLNTVMFTTYTPPSNTGLSASCAPTEGIGKFYIVSIVDGSAVFNFDQTNSDLTAADRTASFTRGGIPPEPTVIFDPDGGGLTIMGGPEVLNLTDDDGNNLFGGRLFSIGNWREQ
ncbi:MAG: PilC/PilY family type IV pilus protein [Gammaproteobacteria bacterium]|nr:PilC/PilY family type IV pilus protein [Gammaproteobacteria bacterium]